MAKKRKGARPTKKTSRSIKKKTTKKASSRRVMAKQLPTGLESANEVDFKPLKKQIRAHIDRLSSVPTPSTAVQNALRSLKQVQFELTGECSPTMVIPTP